MIAQSAEKKQEKIIRVANKKKMKKSWYNRFGTFLSPQDLAMVCGALVVVYMVMGESAELVCDMFTSLPAAVFTYQLLTNKKASRTAYEATLCFWILHGTLVVFDHLLHKTLWYFFVKFLLMSAVSTHVLAKIRNEKPKTTTTSPDKAQQSVKNEIDSPDRMTVSYTKPCFQSFSEKFISASNPHSLHTANDVLKQNHAMHSVGTQTLGKILQKNDHTSTPADLPSVAENVSTLAKNRLISGSQRTEMDSMQMSPMGDRKRKTLTNCKHIVPSYVDTTARLLNEALSPKTCQAFLDSSSGKIQLYGQQDSFQKIIFEEPFDEEVSVAFANSTEKNFVWALKTNSYSRISAMPTCGLVPVGQMIDVRLKISHESHRADLVKIKNDLLVFEYAYVPDSCYAFDSSWLTNENSEKMRKTLSVVYCSLGRQ